MLGPDQGGASREGAWLLVTAAHDEADRLEGLAESLALQSGGWIALWVIVDDGSTDHTAERARGLRLPFPVLVHSRQNTGGLGAASEYAAFREGVVAGLEQIAKPARVMKIDADLRLRPDHLEALAETPEGVGIVGGVIEGSNERAQAHHVRGGLRAYSMAAWEATRSLPVALGWDVLDQVAVRRAGMQTCVQPLARATTSRLTGSSAGLLTGRRRLGVVCRWTGYLPLYLLLKVLRTAAQPPALRGAVALLAGYATAGSGPFPTELVMAHRDEQRARLRALWRNPRAAADGSLYPS